MKHGGDISAAILQYGGTSQEWLDLSTGINPFAYPVAGLISEDNLLSLPRTAAETELISAARANYAVPNHLGLLAAPGTQAIIANLPFLFPAQDAISILSPTYASHAESWQMAGHDVLQISRQQAHDINTPHALIVNPNNPDGHLFSPQELLKIASTLSGYLIVDEAYMDILPEISLLPHMQQERILVMRSFGKFFGLAGLRLGFLAGPEHITTQLQNRLGTWAVAGPALDIGTAALRDQNWQNSMRQKLHEETQHLLADLKTLTISVIGQTDLYTLIEHPNVHDLHDALAHQKIWTRVFDYSKTWMRLGLPSSAKARQRLLNALQSAQEMIS